MGFFDKFFCSLTALRWSAIHPSRYLIVFILSSLTACGDLYLDAPHGSNINLMSKEKPAKIKVEQVVWFKYWGNEPFLEAETHAATIIHEQRLCEARIRMVNTFTDALVSTFAGPFGFPRRTLIVEGNPREMPTESVSVKSATQASKP